MSESPVPPASNPPVSRSLPLRVATLCRQGGRERNEDSLGYWDSDAAACYVVSDGAGGHGGGDVASQAAVRRVLRDFTAHPQVSANGLADFIQQANLEVLENQAASAQFKDMRATIVVLCIDRREGTAVWGHAGDSRLYCFRGGRMLLRTLDHSVIQTLVAAGRYDESALRDHPQRSALLLALGTPGDLEPGISDESFRAREGDVFLLCSDGLWEHLEESLMESLLATAATPEGWVESMEAELKLRVPAKHDNYSGLALWIGERTLGLDDPPTVMTRLAPEDPPTQMLRPAIPPADPFSEPPTVMRTPLRVDDEPPTVRLRSRED